MCGRRWGAGGRHGASEIALTDPAARSRVSTGQGCRVLEDAASLLPNEQA